MTPDDLHQTLDRFLRRWRYVAPANIERFARRSADWMSLPPPPRIAATRLADWGIHLQRETLPPGVDAVWCREADRYVIRISPFLGGPRANFTLWHEWFEMMAARPAFPSRYDPVGLERLANRYAAAVTMPAPAIRRAIAEFGGRGDKTDVIAARFGVSVTALRLRIREITAPQACPPSSLK